jgi:hypothetical protein
LNSCGADPASFCVIKAKSPKQRKSFEVIHPFSNSYSRQSEVKAVGVNVGKDDSIFGNKELGWTSLNGK